MCSVGDRFGAEEVVVHSCRRMVLHHGHVLVRRGVKNHLGLEASEMVKRLFGIDHIMQQSLVVQMRESPGNLAIDLKQGAFGPIDEDQAARSVLRDNSSKFAAN